MRAISTLAPVMLVTLAMPGCYLSHELEPFTDAGSPVESVGFRGLAAGDDHTCGIDARGDVWCWGFAQQGQLGLGLGDESCELRITEGPVVDRPTRLPDDGTDVAIVMGGGVHTCVGLRSGPMLCFGGNCRGQLGSGDVRPALSPRPVASDTSSGVWLLAQGGRAHTCAIDDDPGRRVWCWGGNEYGQLGLGTTSPRSEPGATMPVRVADFGEAAGLALGAAHTCALNTRGAVFCWGANGAGQLGDGTHEVRSRPRPVMLPGAAGLVATGDRHSCAVVGETAWCWGWNERGQLGDGIDCAPDDEDCRERLLPVQVALEGRFRSIDGGSAHTCAQVDGSVHCWGANDVGQLGDGTRRSSASPVRVRGLDDVLALTVGANHACAQRSDGSVWCWGRNAQGQLGDGTRRDSAVPVRALPTIEEGG